MNPFLIFPVLICYNESYYITECVFFINWYNSKMKFSYEKFTFNFSESNPGPLNYKCSYAPSYHVFDTNPILLFLFIVQ